MTSTEDAASSPVPSERTSDGQRRAAAAGCPIVHLDYGPEHRVGEVLSALDEARELGDILWNTNGGYWVATRSTLVREIFQTPGIFTNDSISPGDPDPPYKWIPSNVNAPQHVQFRQ